jgi:hypothetical protein
LKEGGDFREAIRGNPEVMSRLKGNLDEIFDYGFFVRYRDEAFRRAGLI